MFKKWLKDLVGLTQLEEETKAAYEKRELALKSLQETLEESAVKKSEALTEAVEATKKAELAKMSPKEQATINGEPWVAVLDVKVNSENIRNGFFELDWNKFFIDMLIMNGYGTIADPEEEVVDRWFRTIVSDMLTDENLSTDRGMGYINVTPISKNKSEVS